MARVDQDSPTRTIDPASLDTDASVYAPAPEIGSLIGERLGRYAVLETIGAGGMGEVLLGYDPELDRRVAIKLLRSDKGEGDGVFRERLLREAQSLAKLSHPNVVGVYDVGTALGRVWVAMEYIEGATLSQWNKTRRPWREVVAVVRAAGAGLAAAHRVGIVHRDFKPGNVIVGNDGRVRVLDFGLARHLQSKIVGNNAGEGPGVLRSSDSLDLSPISSDSLHDLDRPLTETGSLMGTPAYMAPEQFRGELADERSDQFALCIVLYEALFHLRPFSGRSPRALANAVAKGKVREPPKGHAVPLRVRKVITRGLSIDPDDRYRTTDELLVALARVARPFGVPRWVLPVALVVAAGAVVAAVRGQGPAPPCQGAAARMTGTWSPERSDAVATAFAATQLPYADQSAKKVSAAVEAYAARWVEAHTDACEATQLRGEQSAALLDLRMACLEVRRQELEAFVDLLGLASASTVEQSVQAASRLEPVAPCADAAYVQAVVRPPTDPETAASVAEGRARLAHAKALVLAGDSAAGAPLALSILERAREVDYPSLAAEAGIVAAQAQVRGGDNESALETMGRALNFAAAAGDARAEVAILGDLAALIGYKTSDLATSLRYTAHARGVLERLGNTPALEAPLLISEGTAYFRAGRFEEAQDRYEAGEKLAARDPGGLRTRLAAIGNTGAALGMRGLHADAVEVGRRAVTLNEQELGAHHPAVGIASMNVGASLLRTGKLQEAETALLRAETILEGAFPAGHPELASALHNHAGILAERGDHDGAFALYQRALAMKTALLGEQHPSLGLTTCSIGEELRELGRFDEAVPHFERALAIWSASVGDKHSWNAYALVGLGEIALAERRLPDAVALLERAVGLQLEAAVRGADIGETRFVLARALDEAGMDPVRAKSLATQARSDYAADAAQNIGPLQGIDAWLAQHP